MLTSTSDHDEAERSCALSSEVLATTALGMAAIRDGPANTTLAKAHDMLPVPCGANSLKTARTWPQVLAASRTPRSTSRAKAQAALHKFEALG